MDKDNDQNISSTIGEYIKKYELDKVRYDFLDRLMFIVAAGLGLIAALAWDDVLRELFSKLFDYIGQPLTRLAYAIILTVCATITTIIFKKISKKRRGKRAKSL